MWNWIKRFFSGGEPPDILNFNDIAQIIKGVADYFDYIVSILTLDIAGNWNADQNEFALQLFWINLNYYILSNNIIVSVQNVRNWTAGQISDVRNTVNNVYWAGVARDAALQFEIGQLLPNIERWALSTIFGPLKTIIDDAIKFFLRHIGDLEALIYNPERLLVYLASWLWKLWVKFLTENAGRIAKWLLHSMMAETGVFADILERVIAALI